ncbi:hypothetical protein [Paraburkholderia sp. GAS42]|jgi:hypothetical protein|uniref:hypothetical protein n=1 Tax=Paraburkholderia sp. GAS42 TaxID=3035135 RepID=UPI003D192518
MTSNATFSRQRVLAHENADLLGTLIEKALLAGERYTKEFSKVAALARTIGECELTAPDRARLLLTIEEIASDAETNAQLDVDLFQGLLAGQLLAENAVRGKNGSREVVVGPSTDTRH